MTSDKRHFTVYDYGGMSTRQMKTHLHPGRIVRQHCLEALGLSVTKAAEVLGVSRQAFNNLVNEKAGISPEMAIRLSKAFGREPEAWLQLQMLYELAEARKHESKIKVRRYGIKETVPVRQTL